MQETNYTPWSYDELQLIGAELGDTVDFCNENGDIKNGLIVFLTKSFVYVLLEDKNIFKFSRITLASSDNIWELIGLSEKQTKISKEEWISVKKQINSMQTKRKKKA